MLETGGQFLGQKLLLEISWQRCKNSGRLRACMLTMALFGGGSTRLGSQGAPAASSDRGGRSSPGLGLARHLMEVSFGAVSNAPVAAWVLPVLPARAFS